MSETFNPFFLPNVGVSMMESSSTVVPESFPSSCLMSLVEAVFFHVQDDNARILAHFRIPALT